MDADDWTMMTVDSVRFARPASWQPEIDRGEDGVSVLLQSDAVSFAVVGIYPIHQDPAEIVEQVLDSVRAEHPGLEVEPLDEEATPDSIAREGMFMTLDMVAYCWVRSWRQDRHSLLVFVQTIEPESADGEEVFAGICRSMGHHPVHEEG